MEVLVSASHIDSQLTFTCSKLTIKTPAKGNIFKVNFIVNFKHISHLFLLLNLNK